VEQARAGGRRLLLQCGLLRTCVGGQWLHLRRRRNPRRGLLWAHAGGRRLLRERLRLVSHLRRLLQGSGGASSTWRRDLLQGSGDTSSTRWCNLLQGTGMTTTTVPMRVSSMVEERRRGLGVAKERRRRPTMTGLDLGLAGNSGDFLFLKINLGKCVKWTDK
jgi:hypothetical protein